MRIFCVINFLASNKTMRFTTFHMHTHAHLHRQLLNKSQALPLPATHTHTAQTHTQRTEGRQNCSNKFEIQFKMNINCLNFRSMSFLKHFSTNTCTHSMLTHTHTHTEAGTHTLAHGAIKRIKRFKAQNAAIKIVCSLISCVLVVFLFTARSLRCCPTPLYPYTFPHCSISSCSSLSPSLSLARLVLCATTSLWPPLSLPLLLQPPKQPPPLTHTHTQQLQLRLYTHLINVHARHTHTRTYTTTRCLYSTSYEGCSSGLFILPGNKKLSPAKEKQKMQ